MSRDANSKTEFSLLDLALLLWRQKLMVISIVTATSLIGVIYALVATPVYKAEVVMVPSGQRTTAGNLGQLGSLAALAGVNIGSGGNNAASFAVLKSRELAEDFIRERKLERVLVDDFDNPSKKRDFRDALKRFLLEVRVVSEDKKAGVVSLAIYWEDPTIAAEWANAYVDLLNSRLRGEALAEAQRNVKFLSEEMAGADVVSVQQSLSRILESEMQKYMLAKGADDYAYKVIDRATPPKLREWPRRTLIVVFSGLAGLILACLAIVLRQLIASRGARVTERTS
jgi:uncharacterized protein involved in exopolysaccharide biosynthesis